MVLKIKFFLSLSVKGQGNSHLLEGQFKFKQISSADESSKPFYLMKADMPKDLRDALRMSSVNFSVDYLTLFLYIEKVIRKYDALPESKLNELM